MTTHTRAAQLRFRDLGPLEVERGGVARPVGGARLESVLALLLVHADRPVAADALCEAMWGDQGAARSASTLDSHIHRLRRVLEPDRAPGTPSTILRREPAGYRLVVGGDQVDSTRFAGLATSAADLLGGGSPDRALQVAEEALGLWRGRPFGAAADQHWARAAVARLDEIHGRLRETHIGALIGVGAVDRALGELETALAEEPLRERLWVHRITAYRDGGRRAEALAAFGDARAALVAELGVEPGAELQALHVRVLQDEPPPADPAPTRTTLPAARSRLVGRERETADLLGLLAAGPLVTLVGAAGSGKTRLAVEVARHAAPRFPDGVWFVDLTSAGPDRILDTVTSTLELSVADPDEALRRFTASRRMLVVLDNCEHVLDAAAEFVDGLLVEGSGLVVLATSREPLEVDGEEVVPLSPLATPAAVELFLDRLEALVPGSGGDTASLDRVREIAAAVDGLPLALELAAGRARAYTLGEIAAQVRADASSLSRVGRSRGSTHHRTVRDAIGTSYRDLPAPLAALHRAAGAVPGPFTAGLAAALVGDTVDATGAVAGLVHRSLLTALGPARPDGASRFAQLATVRGHANHLAERAGENPGAPRDAWVERVVRARPALGSPDQTGWYRALDDDLAALRATLQHTLVDAPSSVGVAVAARLGLYWAFSGMSVEGTHWLEAALRADERGLATPADRAMLHLFYGCSLILQSRPEAGRAHVRAGIAAADGVTGDDAALVCAGLVVTTGPLWNDADTALPGEVASAARRVAAGAPELDVAVRHTELVHAAITDPRPELVARFTALHDDARAEDNLYTAWMGAAAAARLLMAGGRPAEALPWARSALRASVEAGLRDNAFVMGLYGTALGMTGDHHTALRVLGAAEAQYRRAGRPWPPHESVTAVLTMITARLGPAAAERLRGDGARTTLVELADSWALKPI